MKNLLFLGTLVSALLITGCSTSKVQENTTKISVDNNIKLYGVKDSTSREYPVALNNKQIVGEDFLIETDLKKDSLDITVKNLSKNVMYINWSEAKYVGMDGKEQRLFNMNLKDKGFYTKAIDSGLRPGESISAVLVPVQNLKVLFGNSTSSQEIFINSNMFENEENKLNDFAKIILPINLDSKKGPIIKLDLYFGVQNSSNKANELLKEVKKVEVTKNTRQNELKVLQNENQRLNDEIKNKEEILRQLREKARLKAELDKKEIEIQELMKKINN